MACVNFCGNLFLKVFQQSEAPPFFFIRYVVRHAPLGDCASARRIACQVGNIQPQVCQQVKCMLELLSRLTRETDNNISSY